MVTYDGLLQRLPGVRRNGDANLIKFRCPNPDCPQPDKAFVRLDRGQIKIGCGGCFQSQSLAATLGLVGETVGEEAGGYAAELPAPGRRRLTLKQWQDQLLGVAYRATQTLPEHQKKLPPDALLWPAIDDLKLGAETLIAYGQLPPEDLTGSAFDEEIERAARLGIEAWLGYLVWSAPAKSQAAEPSSALMCEDNWMASNANELYLARPAVIERLGYTESIMLMIGGKHHGKTSNIRTLALSVARGLPIWERPTNQGHVLYVASADEVASTRYELLNMGWNEQDALTFIHVQPESEVQPEEILEQLAGIAREKSAKLIILDMLFDFVPITDELSYAGTRMAIGTVQALADTTKSLVVCSHHTPKYLTDVHTAANAALGSQGVAARFSPIVFTRKWADDLYSVESTMTRDPRGQELKPQRIERNEQGWIEVVGPFKEYMKWKIYARRVIELFEDNRGLTANEVSTKLELDRPRAQNTLKQLEHEGTLIREKHGRRYVYYLKDTDMFEREGGNWLSDRDAEKS